jgi:hypothetical protein
VKIKSRVVLTVITLDTPVILRGYGYVRDGDGPLERYQTATVYQITEARVTDLAARRGKKASRTVELLGYAMQPYSDIPYRPKELVTITEMRVPTYVRPASTPVHYDVHPEFAALVSQIESEVDAL